MRADEKDGNMGPRRFPKVHTRDPRCHIWWLYNSIPQDVVGANTIPQTAPDCKGLAGILAGVRQDLTWEKFAPFHRGRGREGMRQLSPARELDPDCRIQPPAARPQACRRDGKGTHCGPRRRRCQAGRRRIRFADFRQLPITMQQRLPQVRSRGDLFKCWRQPWPCLTTNGGAKRPGCPDSRHPARGLETRPRAQPGAQPGAWRQELQSALAPDAVASPSQTRLR